MPDLPTLADQRAAGLDLGDGAHPDTFGLDMSEAIRVAIREGGPALKVDRMVEEKRSRTLPTGVYRHSGALTASFSRRVDGVQRSIHVGSGAAGDFSAETADRLARECAAAAAAWDEAHQKVEERV